MARGKKKVNNQSDKDIILNELFGLALIALSLIIAASIFALSQDYLTQDSNPGAIGSILVRAAEALMGEGKYLLPVFLFYLGYRYIKHNVGIKYDVSTLGFGLILIAFLMYLHRDVTFITYQDNFYEAFKGAGGGLLGALFVVIIRTLFGLVGAWILGITFLIAGVIMFTRQSLKNILGNMKSSTKNVWDNNKDTLFDMLFVEEEISSTAADSLPRAEDTLKHASPKKSLLIDMSDHDSSKRAHLNGVNVINSEEQEDSGKLFNEEPDAGQVLESLPFIPEVKTQSASLSKGKGEHKQEAVAAEKDVPIIESNHTSNFILPAFNLLDAKSAKSKGSQRDISGRVAILEETIQSFGINAKVTQVSCGPTVTRFELDIPPGVKVSKITGLADNIALRLAAKGVRIAPIPDQATIGIEVPNKEISPVSFRDVLENESYLNSSSKLSVALGKDISGRSIIANLAKMPHLLVAGTTGSGKSVCMNTIICSILFKATPKDVRFLMIDPKMVELAGYNGIPHLLAPVVTDPKKAAAVLKWMVTEMDNRYEMFAQSNVRDIVRYNQQKLKSGNDLQTMPYYVVIIDELADLMMVASQDVEESICRIAQKARAAGIHLVIATQRPSVDVITGLIKANIPSRIAFAVSSQTDSRTILDGAGAEKLLGRGDMLFHPVGEQNPIRIQGAFVSDKEVENIVGFLKESSLPPQYEEGVLEAESIKSEDKADSGEDALFYRAGITLIEAGQASSSMLQRRLRVGYARAARLIDLLEDNGVVGPHEGSKPRLIIMSLEEFENRFSHQNLED